MLLMLLGLLIMGMVLGIVTAAWVMRTPRKDNRRASKNAHAHKDQAARRQR